MKKLILLYLLTLSYSQDHWETAIYANDEWSYLVPIEEPNSNWNSINYDDSSWLVSTGGFGYGDNDDGTLIPNALSVYIRRTFEIPESEKLVTSILHTDYDDGFIAYLNDIEICRSYNLGNYGDFIDYDYGTNGIDHEAQLYLGLNPEYCVIDSLELSSLIISGENLLAIQVHNVSSSSSDMSSNFFLSFGIQDGSSFYGETPSWFQEPINFNQSNLPIFIDVINNLTIKSGLITQKQSEIIFENAKIFPNHTQISIAIIKDGKVNYYGINNKNDTISTVNNKKSVFEIGSISKVFTSTILANFVIDEKINLNDNINGYLKTSFNNNTEISFINLANHTSGLPPLPSNLDLTKVNPENPYKEYKEKGLEEYLTKHLELLNKEKYQYSNLGAGLLGYTLSKIENTTYENLLQNKIFSKFNMYNSTSDINKIKGNLVKGLNNEGNDVPNWEFSVLAGAGAIFSTVEDLSQFAISQFDNSNKELKLTRKKTFEVNENLDIGLGWHILKSQSKNFWYWHNGGTGGYSSSMVIDENTKNGIIILSNISAFNPNMGNIDKLCFALMKTIE